MTNRRSSRRALARARLDEDQVAIMDRMQRPGIVLELTRDFCLPYYDKAAEDPPRLAFNTRLQGAMKQRANATMAGIATAMATTPVVSGKRAKSVPVGARKYRSMDD